MKFSNGYWLMREGVRQFPCTDVRDVHISNSSVTMYVAPQKMNNRGQTLGGPLLTLKFTAPQEGILNLEMVHYDGANNPGPNYDYANSNCPLQVKEDEKQVTITTGLLQAKVQKEPFQIEY